MQIAKTILQQIKAIDFFALGAWGAKDFIAMKDGLKFKTSGMVKWKGWVIVQYDEGKDLYNLIFGRVRKHVWKEDKHIDGVYVEDLVRLIDEQVG